MRQLGGSLAFWFWVSGPRMANATRLPSAEVSTSLTSQVAPAVMRALMLVSGAAGEALARMNRSAEGVERVSVRMILRSSCTRAPVMSTGTCRFT